MTIKTDFDSKKPYRVIEVKKGDDIKYKITQPLKLWLKLQKV